MRRGGSTVGRPGAAFLASGPASAAAGGCKRCVAAQHARTFMVAGRGARDGRLSRGRKTNGGVKSRLSARFFFFLVRGRLYRGRPLSLAHELSLSLSQTISGERANGKVFFAALKKKRILGRGSGVRSRHHPPIRKPTPPTTRSFFKSRRQTRRHRPTGPTPRCGRRTRWWRQ